jgi:type II secretory pathway pseudopilin PulG
MRCDDKGGQIWVETVIYTLIALTIMGIVLSFAIPKIGQIKDKATIDQTVDVLKEMNNVILSAVQNGPGNKRVVEINIKKGSLTIDKTNDDIIFSMSTDYIYSEPCEASDTVCAGKTIDIGNVKALTKKEGSAYNVLLSVDYTSYNYDLTYNKDNDIANYNTGVEKLDQSTTPYKIVIENKGLNAEGSKTIVDLSLG